MERPINKVRVPMARRGYTYPADQHQRTSRFAEYLENAKLDNRPIASARVCDGVNRALPLIPRDPNTSGRPQPQYLPNHEIMAQQLQPRAPYGRPLPPPATINHYLPIPRPPPPSTIHLLSFSHNHVLHHSNFSSLLSDLVPDPSTHLYTIRAGLFDAPPKHLWRNYTGTHPVIQDHVMRDPAAQEAVDIAVRDLRRAVEGRVGCHVVLSASCGAGTHRSVAVVERIRECLNREGLRDRWNCAVVVRVVHVHRSKRDGDPW